MRDCKCGCGSRVAQIMGRWAARLARAGSCMRRHLICQDGAKVQTLKVWRGRPAVPWVWRWHCPSAHHCLHLISSSVSHGALTRFDAAHIQRAVYYADRLVNPTREKCQIKVHSLVRAWQEDAEDIEAARDSGCVAIRNMEPPRSGARGDCRRAAHVSAITASDRRKRFRIHTAVTSVAFSRPSRAASCDYKAYARLPWCGDSRSRAHSNRRWCEDNQPLQCSLSIPCIGPTSVS